MQNGLTQVHVWSKFGPKYQDIYIFLWYRVNLHNLKQLLDKL